MSSSNCCLLTCIQISQEADKVVWYSDLLRNFPQFLVIHTVKDLDIVNKAERDVFLEFFCFFDDPMDISNLISGSSAFSKSSLSIWKFTVHVLLKISSPSGLPIICRLYWYCLTVLRCPILIFVFNPFFFFSLGFQLLLFLLTYLQIHVFFPWLFKTCLWARWGMYLCYCVFHF